MDAVVVPNLHMDYRIIMFQIILFTKNLYFMKPTCVKHTNTYVYNIQSCAVPSDL